MLQQCIKLISSTRGVESRQRGVALITVLWGTALLAALVIGTVSLVRGQMSAAALSVKAVQARALAEAGVERAIMELVLARPTQRWRADGTTRTIQFAGSTLRISVQDVNGLVDISTAREELIEGVLRVAGAGAIERKAVRDSILDWRDRDQLRRLHGAEDSDYAGRRLDYGAKDAPFDSIEELREVSGIDMNLYARIAPLVTVYSGNMGVNPAVAPESVIRCLPGLSEGAVRTYVAARARLPNGAPVGPLSGANPLLVSQVSGNVFRIRSEATLPGGTQAAVTTTIRLTAGADQPYVALSWRE